jgi:Calcineurin-like phosphoesterase
LILVAGDWHGNTDWALNVVKRVPQLLAGEERRIVLQLGDFGVWPGAAGKRYLDRVSTVLDWVGAELWFVDGNHEDFTQLPLLACPPGPGCRVAMRRNVFHLPRGARWQWHDRIWLACGGAVSLDKALRCEGRDWWPEEEITDQQQATMSAAGQADVMVCHDCPVKVPHRFSAPPAAWSAADLARNRVHRERLQRIVNAVRPAHLMHGHLHRAYQRECDFGYGPVQVTGLGTDGVMRNFAVLDVAAMEWKPRRTGRSLAKPVRAGLRYSRGGRA